MIQNRRRAANCRPWCSRCSSSGGPAGWHRFFAKMPAGCGEVSLPLEQRIFHLLGSLCSFACSVAVLTVPVLVFRTYLPGDPRADVLYPDYLVNLVVLTLFYHTGALTVPSEPRCSSPITRSFWWCTWSSVQNALAVVFLGRRSDFVRTPGIRCRSVRKPLSPMQCLHYRTGRVVFFISWVIGLSF